METHITTHLGYLSNIGGDHISWATKRHVIKIAKIQVGILLVIIIIIMEI